MQIIMIAFVLLFSLLTISLTANVTVYNYYDYFVDRPENLKPVLEPQFLFQFVYKYGDTVRLNIIIKIKSSSVTVHNITLSKDHETIEMEKFLDNKVGEYYHVSGTVKSAEVKIKLNINKFEVLCSSLLVAKGRKVDSTVNEKFLYKLCQGQCVLVVDLTDECDDPVTPPSEQNQPINFVFIYVIASVIGICVIILVMYLSIKKYQHRNSDRVDAIELNTYATTSEVLYADLSLAPGDSQPPRREEESPYAQIIGVMKPDG